MENNNILSLEEAIERSMPTDLIKEALNYKLLRETPILRDEPDETEIYDIVDKENFREYQAEVRRNAKEQWDKLVKEKVEKNPGYFGLPYPEFVKKFNVHDETETPLQGGRLRVDIDEYLDTYKSLLENPGKINDHVSCLDQNISELLLETTMPKKEKELIRGLFGMYDNYLGIKIHADEEDYSAISDYIMREIIEPYFDIDEEDRKKIDKGDYFRVIAHLKGTSFPPLTGPDGTLQLFLDEVLDDKKPCKKIYFVGGSRLPSILGDKENDLYALEGYKTIFDKLKECPEVKGLEFDLGNQACIVPTYTKK